MIYISHRGNLYGRIPERENSIGYIIEALREGFNCEIDVWYFKDDGFYLGHDNPQYKIEDEYFLLDPRLWCHAKNYEAFIEMLKRPNIHCFWHQNDSYAMTSEGYLWTWSHTVHNNKSIIIYPELIIHPEMYKVNEHLIAGYCSDYIGGFKK